MRSDVKTFLERLGKSQFRYKEFADRFSDLETWPVFEAVIRDARIFDRAAAHSVKAVATSQPEAPSIGSVLSRKYHGDPAVGAAKPTDDVRTLLARISAAVERGAV